MISILMDFLLVYSNYWKTELPPCYSSHFNFLTIEKYDFVESDRKNSVGLINYGLIGHEDICTCTWKERKRRKESEGEEEEDNYGAENCRVTYTSRSLHVANEPALGGFRISETTVNHRRWSVVVMRSKKETKETAEKGRVTRRKRERKKDGKKGGRKSEREDRIPE